jgi:hypothetical protein
MDPREAPAEWEGQSDEDEEDNACSDAGDADSQEEELSEDECAVVPFSRLADFIKDAGEEIAAEYVYHDRRGALPVTSPPGSTLAVYEPRRGRPKTVLYSA